MKRLDQHISLTRGSVFDEYEIQSDTHLVYSGSDSESLPEYDVAYTKEVSKHDARTSITEVDSKNEITKRSESPVLTELKKYHDDLFEAIRRSLLQGDIQGGLPGSNDIPTPPEMSDPQTLDMAATAKESPHKTSGVDSRHDSPTDISRTVANGDSLPQESGEKATDNVYLNGHRKHRNYRHRYRRDSTDSRDSVKSRRPSADSHKSHSRHSHSHRHHSTSHRHHHRHSSKDREHDVQHRHSELKNGYTHAPHDCLKDAEEPPEKHRHHLTENGYTYSSQSSVRDGEYFIKSRSRKNSSDTENGYTDATIECLTREQSRDGASDRLVERQISNLSENHTEQIHELVNGSVVPRITRRDSVENEQKTISNITDHKVSNLNEKLHSRSSSFEGESPSKKRKLLYPDVGVDVKRRKLSSVKPLPVKRKHSVDSSSDDKDTDSDAPPPCKTAKCYENFRVTRKKTHQLQRIYSEGGAGTSSASALARKALHRHRTMWDTSIFDPEYSDSDSALPKMAFDVQADHCCPFDDDHVQRCYQDLEALEEQLNKRKPVVNIPKLALHRDDVVHLKNLPELRKSFSGLIAQRSVQSSQDSDSPRHFMDGLQSAGSASPVSVGSPFIVRGCDGDKGHSSSVPASPVQSRRTSEDSEKGGYTSSLASPITSRRSSELSDKGSPVVFPSFVASRRDSNCSVKGSLVASPLNVRRDSQTSDKDDGFPFPPVLSFSAHGPSKLRRLPRISESRRPAFPPASPLIATPTTKDDFTGRLSRTVALGFESKARLPALFSVPSYPPVVISPAAETSGEDGVQRVETFSCQQEEFVNVTLDEESWEYKMKGVEAVSSLTTSSLSPSLDILRKLVGLLRRAPSRQHAAQIHNVLMGVLNQHPPYQEMPFEFDELVKSIDNCLTTSSDVEHHRNFLALQYMVAALDSDVLQRSFNSQRQLNKSVVFQWFSCDGAYHRVKVVLEWLVRAVKCSGMDNGETVLALLDQMLDLALAVHHRPEDLAMKCAIELQNEYTSLPTLEQKSKLVRCLSSPLLAFTLCHRILEDHGAANIDDHPTTAYRTLEDLLPGYMWANPPQLHHALPPTPAETETDSPPPSPPSAAIIATSFHKNHHHSTSPTSPPALSPQAIPSVVSWSAENCEELVLLVWLAVQSYVRKCQYRLHLPVPRRAPYGTEKQRLHQADTDKLAHLSGYVDDLQSRLDSHCTAEDLSMRTRLYLAKLGTLSALSA